MKDNDTVNMDPVGEALAVTSKKRQVRIFFAKPKPGYRFAGVGVDSAQPSGGVHTDGGKSRAAVGDLNNMNATSLGKKENLKFMMKFGKQLKMQQAVQGMKNFWHMQERRQHMIPIGNCMRHTSCLRKKASMYITILVPAKVCFRQMQL